MVDRQLSFKEEKISEILNTVIGKLKSGDFEESVVLLEKALSMDFEYPGVSSSLKSTKFWKDRKDKYENLPDITSRGEYLLNQWETYTIFSFNMMDIPEDVDFSIKSWVFSNALSDFKKLLDETNRYDTSLLLKLGKCYKGIGNYDNAIAILEEANRIDILNPEIIAELADCYALIDEVKMSKVFFREAFFADPQAVHITTMESSLIKKLVRKLSDMGMQLNEIKEWLPVYGNIWGVFNIKRELKPLELGKLKQSIYSYEKSIENGDEEPSVIPRLINRYFWLIDHYISTSEEQNKIDEILQKIRELNSSIFEEYIN